MDVIRRKRRLDREEETFEGQILFRISFVDIFRFGMVKILGQPLREGILRGRPFEDG